MNNFGWKGRQAGLSCRRGTIGAKLDAT